jgi:hypothetical protein
MKTTNLQTVSESPHYVQRQTDILVIYSDLQSILFFISGKQDNKNK